MNNLHVFLVCKSYANITSKTPRSEIRKSTCLSSRSHAAAKIWALENGLLIRGCEYVYLSAAGKAFLKVMGA